MKKPILVILCSSLVLSGFALATDVEGEGGNYPGETTSVVPDDDTIRKPIERDPMLAGGLSLAVPGVGQFYNEQIGKGILHLTLYGGAMWAGFSCVNWYLYLSDLPRTLAVVSFSVALGMMLISMIDAHSNAKELNVKNGYSLIPSNPDINLTSTENGDDLLFSFNFSL
ncbi:MAG: hypothetical protein GY771_10250 [bacterium]|nr:hypothetical protein [bacterium]